MNGRLDAIQAAILQVKLKYFPEEIIKREKIAKRYQAALGEFAPVIDDNRSHVFAQYTICVKNRTNFMEHMKNLGIPTTIHYPLALHEQDVFKDLGYQLGDFPESEKAANEVVSLPMSPFLSEVDQEYIIKNLKEFLKC